MICTQAPDPCSQNRALCSTNVGAGCSCHPTGANHHRSPRVPSHPVWPTQVMVLKVSVRISWSQVAWVGVCGWAPAGNVSGRCLTQGCKVAAQSSPPGLVLRCEHEHHADINRVLVTHERWASLSAAAHEDVLIGIVVTVLKPGDQMTGEGTFEGCSELLRVVVSKVKGGAGGKKGQAVMIVQVFVASRHGHLGGKGVFYKAGNAGIVHAGRSGSEGLLQHRVYALMVVGNLRLERQFGGVIVGQHGIAEIIPRPVVA